jgi:RNA polymerase sigma-70 factor (ECF subfamily)
MLSDDTLVRDTLNGSSDAFRLLVERYRGRLYGVACGMLRSDDQAADAVQDAFLKAYRSLGSYRGGAFAAWLRRILVNECLSILRERHAYLSLEELDQELPAAGRSPEAECLAHEEAGAIRAAMRALPAHYRSALVLRVMEGLSYREISRLLEVPVSTVETWIHRGRQRMKLLLAYEAERGPRPVDQRPGPRTPERFSDADDLRSR